MKNSPVLKNYGGPFLLALFVSMLLLPVLDAETVSDNQGAASVAAKPPTITMELKGVDVVEVLNFFSKESGLNIVAGRGVTGQVTIFLRDVGVRKALETVLEAAGLAMTEEEGLIKVITEQEYYSRFGKPYNDRRLLKSYPLRFAKAESIAPLLEAFRTQTGRIMVDTRSNTIAVLDTAGVMQSVEKLLGDLDVIAETRSFSLRYSKVQDLEPKIKPLISETGSLQVDPRSNRAVVIDTKRKVDQIAKVIESFDVQPSQVLIEARVVQVALNDNARYGINWHVVFHHISKLNEVNLQPNYSVTAPNGATITTLTLGSQGGNSNDIQSVIQVLEQFGKTNTLSSPRITVLNDQEAKLAVATREPFVTQTTVQAQTSSTTADNVQFIDVGVTMNVTPKITDDNFVVLKIKPQVSTEGAPLELQGAASGSNVTFVRTRIPVVTTQEFETTVVVKSGHTIILGGLIQDSEQKSMQKFPVLGDIPWIGSAFRSKTNNFSKTELVIFLAPHILASTSQTKEHQFYFNKRGQLLPFDEVGGYPFDKGIYQSQLPTTSNDKPFWRLTSQDSPQTTRPDRMNSRSYDRYGSPRVVAETSPAYATNGAYHREIESRIFEILNREDLGLKAKKGKVQVLLVLRRDGQIDHLFIPQAYLTRDPSLQKKIEKAIRAAEPFPPFPEALEIPKKQFDMTFELGPSEADVHQENSVPVDQKAKSKPKD